MAHYNAHISSRIGGAAKACPGSPGCVRKVLGPTSGDIEEGVEPAIDEDVGAPLWGNYAVIVQALMEGCQAEHGFR